MATADARSTGRRWPKWLLRPAFWLAGRFGFTHKDIVLWGWFLTCGPLLVLALNPGGVLSGLPLWLFTSSDFVALGAAVYATGLCLTCWRNPPTLWLAVAFGGFAVFVGETLAELTVSTHTVTNLSWGLWWVVPFTVSAWAEAGFAIARAAPLSSRRAWQGVLRAGPRRDWQWARPFLTEAGVPPGQEWTLPWVSIALWSVAAAVTVAGSVPNVFFSAAHATGDVWRGTTPVTRDGYIAFVGFAGVALIAQLAVLVSALFTVDRSRIKQDDFDRLRWAPWAAGMIFVLVAGAESAISVAAGSEALFDLALASSALLFALVALNAAAYVNADVAFSSPYRRLAVGGGWFLLAFFVVLALPIHDLRRAVILAGFMFALPMLPAILRGVEGVPRTVARPAAPDQAKLLRDAMRAPDAYNLLEELGELPSIDKVQETLAALDVDGADVQEAISAGDLVALLGAHKGGSSDVDIRVDPRLSRFVGTFPPLERLAGGLDDRHNALVRLVGETARTISLGRPPGGKHPNGLTLVRVVCLSKAAPVDERGRQRPLDEEEQRLLLAYEVWSIGARAGMPELSFEEAYAMNADELRAERRKRTRRVDIVREYHIPPPEGSQLNAYRRRYDPAVAQVHERWKTMLRSVEALLRDRAE